MISSHSNEISESVKNKQKYESTEYKPPPPIEKIKYENCLDIVNTLQNCMKSSNISNTKNIVSIQKKYTHPIYYPANELKQCVAFDRFQSNEKIKINISDKMNTQIYYTVTCDKANQNIHLQL